MFVRISPHPALAQQFLAPQAGPGLVLLCWLIPFQLPSLVAHILFRWPSFVTLVTNHEATYGLLFFLIQLALTLGAIAFLLRKHKVAILNTTSSLGQSATAFTVIFAPLFVFHLLGCFHGVRTINSLSEFAIESPEVLGSAYHEVWGKLAYGSSLAGVTCSSIMSFVAPVLEEIVFTGFMLNSVGKRCGTSVAILAVPSIFALAHVFQFGVGEHLVSLFFAGLTYALIRVQTGSIHLAVLAHWVINTLIFLPKWVLAAKHFDHS